MKVDVTCDPKYEGSYIYYTPLVAAIWNKDRVKVRVLVEYGADVNLALKPYGANPNRELLPSLFSHMDNETIELLLEHNPDINREYATGQTLLIHAIGDPKRRKQTVPILLRHGAKVTPKNRAGVSALTIARRGQFNDILPLLEAAAKKETAPDTQDPSLRRKPEQP